MHRFTQIKIKEICDNPCKSVVNKLATTDYHRFTQIITN